MRAVCASVAADAADADAADDAAAVAAVASGASAVTLSTSSTGPPVLSAPASTRCYRNSLLSMFYEMMIERLLKISRYVLESLSIIIKKS